MIDINNQDFELLVTQSIERLPEPYKSKINNVAFFVEPEPSLEQRQKLGLRPCQSLFGLYEGVPLTHRMGQTGNLLPDKITIFKIPHLQHANNYKELKLQVANTVWHEVAHYFGLDHRRIHQLENKSL
jgi:predicted Zn-dependent protease with MMP-like domain